MKDPKLRSVVGASLKLPQWSTFVVSDEVVFAATLKASYSATLL